NDAIIQVQEGIVVDANPAWLELYGVAEGVSGEPVMDLFDDSTHAALRGALAACLQGRWKADHPLRVNAQLADGSVLPIEMTLALGEHEGEPCVSLMVPSRSREERGAIARPAGGGEAPGGLLPRRELLEGLTRRLATPALGGMRCLALIWRDKFTDLDRVRAAAEGDPASEGARRTLRRSALPRAPRARQRAGHQRLERAAAVARSEAGDAHP